MLSAHNVVDVTAFRRPAPKLSPDPSQPTTSCDQATRNQMHPGGTRGLRLLRGAGEWLAAGGGSGGVCFPQDGGDLRGHL
jgi:hypothetical protein